jgi:hypothetical protein
VVSYSYHYCSAFDMNVSSEEEVSMKHIIFIKGRKPSSQFYYADVSMFNLSFSGA